MRLFESRQSRNQRMFHVQLVEAQKRLSERMESEEDFRSHSAWLFGGAIAATHAVTLDDPHLLKETWGNGDESKALTLLEVFTLPMVSRWYRTLDGQMENAPVRQEEARRVAASNLLSLFGRSSDQLDQLTSEFLGMDIQFNHDREKTEGDGVAFSETIMLICKALHGCGYPRQLDLNKIKLPASGLVDFVGQIGDLSIREQVVTNVAGLTAFTLCLDAGETAMHSCYADSRPAAQKSRAHPLYYAFDPNILFERGAALLQPHVLLHDRIASEPTARMERDLQESIKLLTQDVQMNPERWQAFWFIGKAHQAMGERANAYDALKEASALAPDEVDVARELWRECLALGYFDEAVSVADHAASVEPDDGGLRSNLALSLLLLDEDDRATVEAGEGVRLAPADAVCRRVQQLVADVRSGQIRRRAWLEAS